MNIINKKIEEIKQLVCNYSGLLYPSIHFDKMYYISFSFAMSEGFYKKFFDINDIVITGVVSRNHLCFYIATDLNEIEI